MSVDPNKYDVGELRQLADGEATRSGNAVVWTRHATAPDDPEGAEAPVVWGTAAAATPSPDAVFASTVFAERAAPADGNSEADAGPDWIDVPEADEVPTPAR